VADSFGVRRSAVRLVSGASSRTKIVDIDAGDPCLLASLLATPGRLRARRDVAAVRTSIMSDLMTRSSVPSSRPRITCHIADYVLVKWTDLQVSCARRTSITALPVIGMPPADYESGRPLTAVTSATSDNGWLAPFARVIYPGVRRAGRSGWHHQRDGR
jgi:hypothetical protein